VILRHVITKDPPLAHYLNTVTGERWFDHDLFKDATDRIAGQDRARDEHLREDITAYSQYLNDRLQNPEAYLAEYHDYILKCLENGEDIPE
jgi:hypothetical protein